MATKNGWWLSTDRTPRSRLAIEDLAVGDLVLVQRSAKNPDRVDNVPHRSIIGLAVAWGHYSWNDVSTGERHRAVCLVPLSFFKHPVPVQTAQGSTWGRLKDVRSIRDMPQLHGQVTTHGRTLSAVNWDDIAEICSVCNLHPGIFTDPIPTVAARLSITPTGNKDHLRAVGALQPHRFEVEGDGHGPRTASTTSWRSGSTHTVVGSPTAGAPDSRW